MISPASRPGVAPLGDVVAVFHRLQPHDANAARIARILGYDLRTTVRPAKPGGAGIPLVPAEPSVPRTARRQLTVEQAAAARGTKPRPVDAPRNLGWHRYLRPVARTALGRPPEGPGLESETLAPPGLAPPEPLLRPSTTPTLLQTLLATEADDGELDLEAVVAALASRQQLEALPVRRHRTLLRGAQLLIDVGPAMAPFLGDAQALVRTATAVVGRNQLDHQRFAGTPLAGAGRGARWTWGPYQPPPPGTPVLATGELGMARVLDRPVLGIRQSWLELQELLSRRGCPLVVLTPFPLDRWPMELARSLRLLPWDRSSTASAVQRLLDRARNQG